MRPRIGVLALLTSVLAFGQSYKVSTFAGGGLPVNVPGTSATLGKVVGTAVDSPGNIFIVSADYKVVLRLDAMTNVLTLVAGNGAPGFGGDKGPAISAQLSSPSGVAVDAVGNVFIVDTNRIRKISSGIINTVAGSGTAGFSGDNGPAVNAQLSSPSGVAVDSVGNVFVADRSNNRIRKISSGIITTVAGNGTAGFSGDSGPAASAQLSSPSGVAVDSVGNLYIADSGNSRIRKISSGIITTVAGNGTAGFSGDNGPAVSAQLSFPQGVAVDSVGNVLIVDFTNRIREISRGIITTVAGNGTAGFSGDNGPAVSAQLSFPQGVAIDSVGNVYIADSGNSRMRKISSGIITTVAGSGTTGSSGDNGPATSGQLLYPTDVAMDSTGDAYIADYGNHRIRKVANGVITTVAGNGTPGFSGDNGSATSAQLYLPEGVAVDSAGNVYIAESGTNRIRKVSGGIITTVAGNGTSGFSGDNGPATSAELTGPSGVAVDAAGNLFIADYGNNRIRKVSSGMITTVAGNGTAGFSGDNGPATSAELFEPEKVAVDSDGNLYIADFNNNRIRKISNGTITTVAGGGSLFTDNVPATSARLSQVDGVAVDTTGSLYISDWGSNLIQKVSGGVINTLAAGVLNSPGGLAADSAGNLYVADFDNNRIQLLTPSGTTPPLSINGVSNAASNLSGPIAPGEIVVLFGAGLGPAQLTSAYVGSDGLYDALLAGTSVQFNGKPSTMIYTSATQVAAIVPYEITGSSAQVTVTYQGQTSTPFTAVVAASAPGLFTLGSTGQGQAAVVNQNGSINAAATPAKVGDIISVYATGEGQTTPSGTDGKPATVPYPHPNLPVSVTISGQTVTPMYVGGAPGEVAGLMQINVQIPTGIQTGPAVPVVVQVGTTSSQSGVTIAVQ